ncbi:rabenosyn-5 [Petromyzon marinus]|uniref:rabenosyn-5 n=1 Tax=Petromyzon marinus TaxID=7757 RepID=UPI003F6F808E
MGDTDGDTGPEIREGFLCPMCVRDFPSVYQLQAHYEDAHSEDDRHVVHHIKNLLGRAKSKLLKRDEKVDPGTDGGADSVAAAVVTTGGIDTWMWEPQEPGLERSHLDDFKRVRAARIDRSVIEMNRLLIRLEKLTSFDRVNTDPAKRKALERLVVTWVSDEDVPCCPDCGRGFSVTSRRHHCRLCGSIMCKRCTHFLTVAFADKLTSANRVSTLAGSTASLSAAWSGGSAAGAKAAGRPGEGGGHRRRGSTSSVGSLLLEDKDDERVRCCRHCREALVRHEHQMDEQHHQPAIVALYEKLHQSTVKVEQLAPEYGRMADSLNAGETTYTLDQGNAMRMELMKLYELVDVISKKILNLGVKDDPPPHAKALKLQKMIRYSVSLFVQEKLLGLQSLPTADRYEELKEGRRREAESRVMQERQTSLDSQQQQQRQQQQQQPRRQRPAVDSATGWLPESGVPASGMEGHGGPIGELDDPLLQQIANIRSYVRQAVAAGRVDEARTLRENLQQLQQEYDAQQMELAQRVALKAEEDEEFQARQLNLLRERSHRDSPAGSPARSQGHDPAGSPARSQGHDPAGSPARSQGHDSAGSPARSQGHDPTMGSPARSQEHEPTKGLSVRSRGDGATATALAPSPRPETAQPEPMVRGQPERPSPPGGPWHDLSSPTKMTRQQHPVKRQQHQQQSGAIGVPWQTTAQVHASSHDAGPRAGAALANSGSSIPSSAAAVALPPGSRTAHTTASSSLPAPKPSSLNPFELDEADGVAGGGRRKRGSLAEPIPVRGSPDGNPFAQTPSPKKTGAGRHEAPNGSGNPFEEEEVGANGRSSLRPDESPKPSLANPFEDDATNPFHQDNSGRRHGAKPVASSSSNPFEVDDNGDDGRDGAGNVGAIDPELLRQQIDNIRAFIFDAKHGGRSEEVAALTQNLRELQQALVLSSRRMPSVAPRGTLP